MHRGEAYGWRVVVAAVGLLLVAATLAGCGSGDSGRIVLHSYSPADGADEYAAAAAACSRAAGGRYTIQMRTGRRSTDDQRLQLARRLVANDSDLDIMLLDVIWTAEFAQAGWILPYPADLARHVEQETLQGPYETGTYQGRLYAAPLNTNTQLLWYRTDLVPHPPQTWDEMIQMAEDLATRGLPHFIGVQGAQYEGLTVWFNTLVTTAGGSILSENGEVEVSHGDAARRAMDIMARVATSPAADPSLSVAKETDARLAMEAGLAAFQVNYPYVHASVNTPGPDGGGGTFIDPLGRPTIQDTGRRVRDVFGWTAYPSVMSGKPATVTVGGLNLGVSTTSQHPAEAFEAVQCLRNRENQLRNAIGAGGPPTLRELYDDPAFQREYPAWQAIRDSLAAASVRPKTPAYQNVSIVISDLLNPPAEINPETMLGRLTEGIAEAVKSEGLVP